MCIRPPGNPAWYWSDCLTAGLLTRGLKYNAAFPASQWLTACCRRYTRQSAHSCGGSHGFGPDWVVRTVFPINPLEFIRRGTVTSSIRNFQSISQCIETSLAWFSFWITPSTLCPSPSTPPRFLQGCPMPAGVNGGQGNQKPGSNQKI